MEEKKKVNLITALLVLIVIMLITVASLMYVEIQNTKTEMKELSERITNFEPEDDSKENLDSEPQKEEESNEKNDGVKGTFIEFDSVKREEMLTETPVEKILYAIYNDEEKVNNILNNYCHKYSWIGLGDSASWTSIECNYDQYEAKEVLLEDELKTINSTIELKIADETEYTENVARRINKDFDYSNASITERIKFQYEMSLYDSEESEDPIISIGEPHFGIKGMLIMNGNNKSEEDYNNNSRAKKIKITINNEDVRTVELKDTNEPQLIDIDYKQNHIKTPLDVKIEVIETYKGLKSDDVYITDIGFATVSSINGSH